MDTHYCRDLSFPDDEGGKKTEFDWWYLTTHFKTESGGNFSYTLAYIKRSPIMCTRQTSITDENKKKYFWELEDGYLKIDSSRLDLEYRNSEVVDYWRQDKSLFSYILSTKIRKQFNLEISLESNKPPLVHDSGRIQMGHGGLSFYYSLTNLSLTGKFTHDGVTESISGVAWLDRQWGSWNEKGYDGWEWFAIQLNENTEIMLYIFFDFLRGHRITPALSIMLGDGTSVFLNDEKDFSLYNTKYLKVLGASPFSKIPFLSKSFFSNGWLLKIPKYGINLTIAPIMANQRINGGSWEGSCRVTGKYGEININRICTVELTHLYVYPRNLQTIKNFCFKLSSFFLKGSKG